MLESETFRRSLVLDDTGMTAEKLIHGYIGYPYKDMDRELSGPGV